MRHLRALLQRGTLPPLWIVLPALTLGLTGCVSGSAPVSDFCLVQRPIYFDRGTTDTSLAEDLDELNATWVCLCENDCPG